jgi:cyd operon protein YbgE
MLAQGFGFTKDFVRERNSHVYFRPNKILCGFKEPARARPVISVDYPNPGWMRFISIAMAVALSALILIYPRAVAASVSEVNHGLLNLLMWGIASGFIHGVGFVPRMAIWRLVFNPLVGWGLMLFGIALTLSAR